MEFLNYLLIGITFVVMISILVAAHELGHYLFARLFGMGVEEFAVGFGKRPLVTYLRKTYRLPYRSGQKVDTDLEEPDGEMISFTHGGMEGGKQSRLIRAVAGPNGTELEETTNFTIRPWPLGGFVRIKGMIPQADGSETRVAGGFYSKPPWQRLVVLFAGPLFSILTGILILAPVFMIDGVYRTDPKPIVGGVLRGDPAFVAGIRPGDEFVAINGQPVTTFYEVIQQIKPNGGKTLNLVMRRDGTEFRTTVMPTPPKDPTPVMGPDLEPTTRMELQAKIGIIPNRAKVPLSAGEATQEAILMPVRAVTGLVGMFARPETIPDNLGGPGTMVALTKSATEEGVLRVISLAGLLSISVGIFNLLPIYPLDGGQMMVAIAEMVRGGRRLSFQVQETIGTVGLVAVLVIFLGAIFSDVKRFVPGLSGEQKQIELKADSESPRSP